MLNWSFIKFSQLIFPRECWEISLEKLRVDIEPILLIVWSLQKWQIQGGGGS